VKKGEKGVSVEFRVFGKKNKRKVPGKKMVKILLSSCSLVGLYVNLQVKVAGKKMKIFKVFFG